MIVNSRRVCSISAFVFILAIANCLDLQAGELIPFALPWDDAEDSITNVSHLLEKPAGKNGFIRVRDGHFVDGSGKRFRILGVNNSFSGNYPTHQQAISVAARLAKFGVNCIRFHHTDTRRAPNGIWKAGTEVKQQLDPESLDRMDYFIAQLKENGIYANINLKIGREAVEADGIPFADRLPTYDKGPDHYYPRLIELQKNYARDLLTHRNPYTGNRYIEEPAIATIEINNESGLVNKWRQGDLDTLPELYLKPLQADWNAFLQHKYNASEDLIDAWTPEDIPKQEKLENNTVDLILKKDFEGRSHVAKRDIIQFLIERESQYYRDMIDYLHNDLGAQPPIAGTQLGFGVLPSQMENDFIDIHGYWQHPVFPGRSWDSRNWYVRNKSIVNEYDSVLARLMLARVEGRAYTVSEYNHPAPNTYSSEVIPLIAAYGAFQDWDGIYYYSYSHSNQYERKSINNFFDIYGHTPKMMAMPAAANIFLRGDIRAADDVVTASLSRDQFTDFLTARGGSTWNINSTAFGTPKTAPYLHKTVMRFGENPPPAENPSTPASQRELVSDTNELEWNHLKPDRSYVLIRSRKTKGFIGFVAEESFDLGQGIHLQIGDTIQNWANVLLTFVRSDEQGHHWLLTATGYAENTGMKWTSDAKESVGQNWGSGPPLVETIPLRLTYGNNEGKPRLFALDNRGKRTKEIGDSVRSLGGGTVIDLMQSQPSLWYEVLFEKADVSDSVNY